jgi:D-alanyl-D-alanine carboxypeptidase/D-alanyl-D-alanine-endopeptidase (penicillin-binding protein 4)
MFRAFLIISFIIINLRVSSQESSLERLLADSSMSHASVSLCVTNAENGEAVLSYNSGKSLTPASVMKLITSAAALELLGPQYTFRTALGYTGTINKRSGKLRGNLVITGGGDPALGSNHFPEYYNDFLSRWVTEIRKLGIRKIEGRVITDDSYYDFQPVPAKWLWEDAGNYYGAGAYGLSIFDNTYEIHLTTSSDSSQLFIKEIVPSESKFEFSNWLIAAGTSDEGYIFAAPYSTNGWLAGSIPANMEDFVLKASIADPPRLMAKMINDKLEAEGIIIAGDPTTARLEQTTITDKITPVTETQSPPLVKIIEVLNHESVNLYAEHLIKELGKKIKNTGSTAAGVEAVKDFLKIAGIQADGMFIEDGSGLSPVNSINANGLSGLLLYMKTYGRYFPEYYNSLPDAGKEGTLKNCFLDPVFESRLRAKSGSMTRVRSYAGYFTTQSGKQMIFSIIVNNFSGPSKNIISGIEEIIKEIIINQ